MYVCILKLTNKKFIKAQLIENNKQTNRGPCRFLLENSVTVREKKIKGSALSLICDSFFTSHEQGIELLKRSITMVGTFLLEKI